MKKRYWLVCIPIIGLLFIQPSTIVNAAINAYTLIQYQEVNAKEVDQRATILSNYLKQYNSPLANFAQTIIQSADENGIDWKIIPAIAGAESTFARTIPGGHNPRTSSYNAWGWGVYDGKTIRFKSFSDGIKTVTKGVKEGYISKGLNTPKKMNPVYAQDPNWWENVDYFLTDIQDYYNKQTNQYDPSQMSQIDITQKRLFVDDAYLKVEDHQFKLMFVDGN